MKKTDNLTPDHLVLIAHPHAGIRRDLTNFLRDADPSLVIKSIAPNRLTSCMKEIADKKLGGPAVLIVGHFEGQNLALDTLGHYARVQNSTTAPTVIIYSGANGLDKEEVMREQPCFKEVVPMLGGRYRVEHVLEEVQTQVRQRLNLLREKYEL